MTGSASSPYRGWAGTIATMHGKEAVIYAAFRERHGLHLIVSRGLDTDAFGTFSGETPRIGSMMATAVAKARSGMAKMGVPIGIASEGSYGPHPAIPLLPGGIELMVFIDAERDIVISEHLIDDAPIYEHAILSPGDDLKPFLNRICFPKHAVIVRAHRAKHLAEAPLFKGVTSSASLPQMLIACAEASDDGMVLVQTDMRAHFNSRRMETLGRLALALAERVAQRCPACGTPGFGKVDIARERRCVDCGEFTTEVSRDVLGCAKCSFQDRRLRPNRDEISDPRFCVNCNP